MPSPLQLTLFGSPEVRLHGQPVTGFRTSKAQALLYYLAVTGRTHTRATLAGLLWGDQPEDAARASLSKCLSNLRDLLGDALLIDRQTAAFNRDYPYDLDTERFAAAVGQPPPVATSQALQAALALYRGDLLEGFYVRDAPDFEQWLLMQRAHYREAVINGLHMLAGFYEQGGDLPSAITHTRRLLALEPWREEAHRQLMTWLARSGQRAAALAQFETCRSVLVAELAVEPDAETVAVMEMIRTGKFSQALPPLKTNAEQAGDQSSKTYAVPDSHVALTPVWHNFPVPLSPLLGRMLELAELDQLMVDQGKRLITITGSGGMGKTRLALAVAECHLATKRFPDGVCFVSLAAIDDDQAILSVLVNALGLAAESSQTSAVARKRQVFDFLANRQMLLLFDNFEQVAAGRTLLLEILTVAPAVHILVTARERLHLHEEQVYPISGLDCPTTLADQTAPALVLFLRTAQHTYPRFQPNPEERGELVRICQQVAGMPLALELAASWVYLLPLSAIAAALQTNLDLLETTAHDLPARHRSMRATFDTSWHLLTAHERQLFAQLSIFRGGFTLDAAQQVVGATLKQLSALVAKSLIEYQRPADRYEIHELLRQYGRDQLAKQQQKEETRRRHANYYVALAEYAETEMRGSQLKRWLDHLKAEHNNIRTILAWALEIGDITMGLQLCGALRQFWDSSGYILEAHGWFEKFLRANTAVPIRIQAKARIAAGAIELIIGNTDKAKAIFQQSLELYQRLEDTLGIASSSMELGNVYTTQGDYEQASLLFQQSLTLYHELNDRWGIAAIQIYLGGVASDQGHYAQATIYLEAGLELMRELDDRVWTINALEGLAFVAGEQHEYQKATTYFTEALKQWRALEDKVGIAYALNSLGRHTLYAGNLAQAQTYLAESFALAQTLGIPRLMSFALANQGNIAFEQGEHEQATNYYRQSLETTYHSNEPLYIAILFERMAAVTSAQQKAERTIILLGAAEKVRKTIGIPLLTLDQLCHQQIIESVRTQVDEVSFAIAWAKGENMTLNKAVVYALGKAPLEQLASVSGFPA